MCGKDITRLHAPPEKSLGTGSRDLTVCGNPWLFGPARPRCGSGRPL